LQGTTERTPMKIQYNAPVVLTFALICTLVLLLDAVVPGDLMMFFTVPGHFSGVLDIPRLFTHVLGHAGVMHLYGNMLLILLLGPILEEKYGAMQLLGMIAATALVTGLLNIAFLDSGLLGASGVVFMMILLSSITNVRAGMIPLTFILVVALWLGQEVWDAMGSDSVSQFAHIVGGGCGAAFGFFGGEAKKKSRQESVSS
jgi:membrane associated rhomboid family serine protease